MKRALVTGGASALGMAISRRLAADGLHVVIHAHSFIGAAQQMEAEIRRAGGSAETLECDLRDRAGAKQKIEGLLEAGVPQVVVHNAGTHEDILMAAMSPEQWDSVIDVSLNGFYRVLRPLLVPMMATRWGRIVAVSSVSAIIGNRGQVNYAAAKAGLIGAVKSLAREVASRGITVNAVVPGIIASPAVARVLNAERIADMVPMRRPGTPEEVADLVGFLCSDQAGYIAGQAISINGGMA